MTISALFVCNMNAVRSPMAAALLAADFGDAIAVDSAGLYANDYEDPFVGAVLGEIGVAYGGHTPQMIDALDLSRFSVVVALTDEAADALAGKIDPRRLERWLIANPSDSRGGRDEALAAYRAVRDDLRARIKRRFGKPV